MSNVQCPMSNGGVHPFGRDININNPEHSEGTLIGYWKLVIGNCFILLCLFSIICSNIAFAQEDEIRALWVTRSRMTSPERIDEIIKIAKEYNFNTIFVQVRGRGEAFYRSSIEPIAPLIYDPAFDPLAYTLEKAHQENIKVHAWLNAYFVWSAKSPPASTQHVVLAHPDWVRKGTEGLFLSPAIKEVNDYLFDVYMEVVRNYNIDGIHFDYIRYLDNNSRQKYVDERCNGVTDLVRRVYNAVNTEYPSIEVSAAVFPEAQSARFVRGQDWAGWLKEGIVDFIVPMTYSTSTANVGKCIKEAANKSNGRYILMGIGAYLLSADSLREKLIVYRNLKDAYYQIKGISLFSFDNLRERKNVLQTVKSYFFSEPASFPIMPWKNRVEAKELKIIEENNINLPNEK